MKASELRNLHLTFYKERGHEFAAAASLIPEDDASVLYISAGMQPLIPFLMGKKHPKGNRLVNVQRCVRTDDIDEVGDDYHLTMFEMLGNWSLGDYFKSDAIKMSFEFITERVGIPVSRLAVTVHKGNDLVEEDHEAIKTWLSLGLIEDQIFYYGDEENWWGPIGETGPCGPDSEMFYVNELEDCSEGCGPACNCGKYVEIGNNVFMSYDKQRDGTLKDLEQKNIDVGLGFERLLILNNALSNVYETDLFLPIIKKIEELTNVTYDKSTQKSFRVISEHIRASVFILADPKGIVPSNSEQGYILRRLIRRAIRMTLQLGVENNILLNLARVVIDEYKDSYSQMKASESYILDELRKEYNQFSKTLRSGLKVANKYFNILDDQQLKGEDAFKLYDTYGFPLELTIELAKENEKSVDVDGFNKCFESHKKKSRTGSVGKFKGGLAESNETSIKLHTATHLLNSALRRVLGNTVNQRGSHINSERLRFDFSFERKMTKEEIESVEQIINEAIERNIDVSVSEMSIDEAKSLGAIGVFDSKYGEKVKVYKIDNYSLEICGGPHVKNTSELNSFKIIKEQSSSAGVRRIKAVIID
jgi:alanyl-tRNA synthetase